ncbi:MAG: glycosyltransferase family 4 protein [Candidatus Pacebacteria bacterium]|nr:glycosyltransferase family 4 protein [Candidatus Paceibacterota bacterium]
MPDTIKKKDRKQKRAAVYDRWLHTLGGGEQVAFAYAETLRDLGYRTEILTHKKFDMHEAESKMHVDLHDITMRYLPNFLDYQLSQYTEGYDVFVSNSYLDYIPNRSKYGVLSIFFPSRIKVSVYEYMKRAHIIPSLRRFFIYPSQFEGFRYDEYRGGRLYKWLGKESTIYFNQNTHHLCIELRVDYLAFSCIDQIFFRLGKMKVEPVSRIVNRVSNAIQYEFTFTVPVKDTGLTIVLPESEYSDAIALTSMSINHPRYMLYNLFKSLFPTWEMRLHGGPSPTRFSDIDSYDRVIAISKFSQDWIHRYWGMRSGILYPPVDVKAFAPAKQKKNIIMHVGRFFLGGHSKKQLDMARVFKRLVETGLKDWELHFVGGIAEGHAHRQYVESIKEESLGYPIFLHTNVSFTELRTLLSEAKIYWHATGLDEDNERYPVRLEHFGITTVEAMASGCVPVVINCGGQPEIVTQDCGFVWNTREELMRYTILLIQDPKILKEKSRKALERSQYFSRERFKKELVAFLPKT